MASSVCTFITIPDTSILTHLGHFGIYRCIPTWDHFHPGSILEVVFQWPTIRRCIHQQHIFFKKINQSIQVVFAHRKK